MILTPDISKLLRSDGTPLEQSVRSSKGLSSIPSGSLDSLSHPDKFKVSHVQVEVGKAVELLLHA